MSITDAITPVISLVVPIYNAEKYLRKCLESLVNQTFKNLEIICINDGSSDGSEKIVRDYMSQDPRIFFFEQENQGVSSTRNKGIQVSRGRFLLFVDSDDYISIHTCEHLIGVAERDHADIVVFGGKTFPTTYWADDSFANRDVVYTQGRSIQALLYEPGSIPLMCNKLYSTELLKKAHAKFNEELTLGEDNAFQFNIFPCANTISYTKEVLYFYRGHEASALGYLKEDHDTKAAKHLDMVAYVLDLWRKRDYLTEHSRELLEWLSGFLYNDMQFVSFNQRVKLSEQLSELILLFFPPHTVDKLGDEVWGKLDFMLQAKRVLKEDPLVTFVITDDMRSLSFKESLESIANQSEQRIEYLIECAKGDEISERFAFQDSRCRLYFKDMSENVLDLCRSPRVIFSTDNCIYQKTAVAQLIDHLDIIGKKERYKNVVEPKLRRGEYKRGNDAFDVDAVIFTDSLNNIRTEDPFFKFQPSMEESFEKNRVFSFENISNRGFCACSLHPCNKMFSVNFLRNYFTENPITDNTIGWRTIIAMKESRRILFFKMPLVSFSEVQFEGEYFLLCARRRLAETLSLLISFRNSMSPLMSTGYNTALAEFCLTIDDSLFDFNFYQYIFPVIHDCAKDVNNQSVAKIEFYNPEDAEQFNSLCFFDSQTHYNKKVSLNLRRAVDFDARNLYQLGEALGAVSRLSADIEEFYQSISYRVGRVVTWPVRKVVYMIKAIVEKL